MSTGQQRAKERLAAIIVANKERDLTLPKASRSRPFQRRLERQAKERAEKLVVKK